MDYGKSFTFAFEDKEWITKILIGGILLLIPIVNLVVIGYALKTIKNVADGAEQPLPDWADFGDYFVKGLMAALGSLVWALPSIALGILIAVVGAFTGNASSDQSAALSICVSGLSCLSGLYGLFIGIVLPAAWTKYAISDDFGAFFHFSGIFRFITANLGNYIIAILLAWVASFIAGFGIVLCFVGIIFTQFWATLVGAHLFGQLYRASAAPVTPAMPTPEPTV